VIAGNWNRRFKHNREKMRTGDVLELVGVIRNLMNRSIEKGLSSGERQMMGRAKRILASEIQYAKDLDEAEAQAYLDELLEEIALERETAASRAAT
jgi:CarD family transcriptional regulator